MTKGDTAKRVAILLGGFLFVYVASFGPVLMVGGIGKSSWYHPMNRGIVSNRGAAIADGWHILIYYEPIFWMCERSPAFESVMRLYVSRCYEVYHKIKQRSE